MTARGSAAHPPGSHSACTGVQTRYTSIGWSQFLTGSGSEKRRATVLSCGYVFVCLCLLDFRIKELKPVINLFMPSFMASAGIF